MGKKLHPAIEEMIRQEGPKLTVMELAKLIRRSPSTTWQLLYRRGIKPVSEKKERFDKDTVMRIVEMRKKGIAYKVISYELNISMSHACNLIKKYR